MTMLLFYAPSNTKLFCTIRFFQAPCFIFNKIDITKPTSIGTSTASGTSMRLVCVTDILDIPGLMGIPDWDCVHFRVVGLTYILESRD